MTFPCFFFAHAVGTAVCVIYQGKLGIWLHVYKDVSISLILILTRDFSSTFNNNQMIQIMLCAILKYLKDWPVGAVGND